mgnify:CR=1 FL=1
MSERNQALEVASKCNSNRFSALQLEESSATGSDSGDILDNVGEFSCPPELTPRSADDLG